MRVLGLDYGDVSIGVSVCDPLGLTAQGLETLRRDKLGAKGCLRRIAELSRSYGVSVIVLGFPKNMNNTVGPQAAKVLAFKAELEALLPGVKVVLMDERLTTASAERVLLEGDVSRKARNRVIDRLSAVFILQAYLDGLRTRPRGNNTVKIKKTEAINIKDNDQNKDQNKDQSKRKNPDQNPGQPKDVNGADWDESIVVITDDTGKEIEFFILDELTHNGANYLLVIETELLDDDEAEAVIFKEVGENDDDLVYEELDDEEFETVAKLFDERLEDYDIEY